MKQRLKRKKLKAVETHYKPLTTWLKKILGNEVASVGVSKRLETSPGAVVTGDYGWTANMERIMTNQVFASANSYGHLKPKKTFEINPNHPIVKNLLEKVNSIGETEGSEEETLLKDNAVLLYHTCLLSSGFPIPSDSAVDFRGRLERLIRAGMGVSIEAPITEVDIEIPESETEKEATGGEKEDDENVAHLDL